MAVNKGSVSPVAARCAGEAAAPAGTGSVKAAPVLAAMAGAAARGTGVGPEAPPEAAVAAPAPLVPPRSSSEPDMLAMLARALAEPGKKNCACVRPKV